MEFLQNLLNVLKTVRLTNISYPPNMKDQMEQMGWQKSLEEE